MSSDKDNGHNHTSSMFNGPYFPPYPGHSYGYVTPKVAPCNYCMDLQHEMRNMDMQMKLMNKNIELINEQLKLLDMKLSIMSNKEKINPKHQYENKQRYNKHSQHNQNQHNQNQLKSEIKQRKNDDQENNFKTSMKVDFSEPKIVMKMDEKQKNPLLGSPLGSLFSFLDSLEDKIKNPSSSVNESKNNTKNDDDVEDEFSEYTSEDEFDDMNIKIETIDDLIKLGKEYDKIKDNDKDKDEEIYTDEPKDADVKESSSDTMTSPLIIKGVMFKDGRIKFMDDPYKLSQELEKKIEESTQPLKSKKQQHLENLVKKDKKNVTNTNNKQSNKETTKKNECVIDGKKYYINLRTLNKLVNPLTKLKNMIGLDKLKDAIVDMIMYYLQNFESRNNNLLHTVIEGPPGVGKTEVGKIMAEIYAGLGVIPSNRFKLVKRTDLIGEYLGQTAQKTQKVIDEANGGVLFIDEAYSLGNGEKRDSYSKECIDTLNQNLTENKKKLIVILAGYANELEKSFFSMNPGLYSRFPFRFTIDNYNAEELCNIFVKKVTDMKWKFTDDNDTKYLSTFFTKNLSSFPDFGRSVENLLSNCKFVHARRVFGMHPKNKRKLSKTDIEAGFDRFCQNKKKEDMVAIAARNSMYS